MPVVKLNITVDAPIEQVWETVKAVDRYPEIMESVRSVEISQEETGSSSRMVKWSVMLKGAVLEWVEREVVDHETFRITFEQISGDLRAFEGEWSLSGMAEAVTDVELRVEFDIGIPLLAEMLNPVAERALRENCIDMLRGVETRATAELSGE